MGISKRLRQAMLKANVGFLQLVKRSKIPKSTLANLLSEKQSWNHSQLEAIASTLEISLDWLVRGIGSPISETTLTPGNKILVPIVGYADCGKPAENWYQAGNKFVDAGDVSGLNTPFILVARGDSMRPYINPYDKLLCTEVPFDRIKDNTAVVVVYKSPPESAEANAKLILKRKESCILYSINTKYPPEEIQYSNIHKIYKLIRIIRDVR